MVLLQGVLEAVTTVIWLVTDGCADPGEPLQSPGMKGPVPPSEAIQTTHEHLHQEACLPPPVAIHLKDAGSRTGTHSRGRVEVLKLFEDFLSVSQLLVCFAEQRLENDLRRPSHMSNQSNRVESG